MLVTDAGDYALMDVRVIEFDAAPESKPTRRARPEPSMAELAPRERLQPSLLDRLSDDEPDNAVEPRERRVLSLRTLREGVLRDLAWLLNTHQPAVGAATSTSCRTWPIRSSTTACPTSPGMLARRA